MATLRRSLACPLATPPFRLRETHGPEVANPSAPPVSCASYCDLHTAVRLRATVPRNATYNTYYT